MNDLQYREYMIQAEYDRQCQRVAYYAQMEALESLRQVEMVAGTVIGSPVCKKQEKKEKLLLLEDV